MGAGSGESFSVAWVLHGPQKSLKPMILGSAGGGLGYDAGVSVSSISSDYTGPASEIRRSDLLGPAVSATVGLRALGNVSMEGSLSRVGEGHYVIGTGASIGAGMPSPVAVGGSVKYMQTVVLYDFHR